MEKISLEAVMHESRWVAKMQGWRDVGTYDEICHHYNDPDCRDIDLCCEQPQHLKPFFDAYFEYTEHHYMTIPEYYNEVYSLS